MYALIISPTKFYEIRHYADHSFETEYGVNTWFPIKTFDEISLLVGYDKWSTNKLNSIGCYYANPKNDNCKEIRGSIVIVTDNDNQTFNSNIIDDIIGKYDWLVNELDQLKK